jgi:hypothetical protein
VLAAVVVAGAVVLTAAAGASTGAALLVACVSPAMRPPHAVASTASASAPNRIRTVPMLARRRQSPRAALSKRVYGARKTSRFTPIGPLRCFDTMISATPRSVDSAL